MQLFAVKQPYDTNPNLYQPVSLELQLSQTTCYYIIRLLRQISSYESADLVAFKDRLSVESCTQLDQVLRELYVDEADLAEAILKLENLVYFYSHLNTQSTLYSTATAQLLQIRQQIFHLLGFNRT